ncbi:mCG147513 [Mus musculus]|nr:mCG147513 [Mus musculus]
MTRSCGSQGRPSASGTASINTQTSRSLRGRGLLGRSASNLAHLTLLFPALRSESQPPTPAPFLPSGGSSRLQLTLR